MFGAASFGKRLQGRRKAQGLTQEQLGVELGVSGQAVSKWENGESIPDLSLVPSLCKVLGTSADALLDIDGGVGIETLSQELASKLSGLKEPARVEAAMQALKYLTFLGKAEPNLPWMPGNGNHLDFEWKAG